MRIIPFPPANPEIPEQSEPRWKSEVRGGFLLLSILVALSLLMAGVITVNAHDAGKKAPIAYHIIPLTQHGKTKYITERENGWIRFCWMAFTIGLPGAFVIGLFLHFCLKVDLSK